MSQKYYTPCKIKRTLLDMPAVYTISVLKPVAVFEISYFDQYYK